MSYLADRNRGIRTPAMLIFSALIMLAAREASADEASPVPKTYPFAMNSNTAFLQNPHYPTSLASRIRDPQAARHNYYFDVMNEHSYSRASDLYDYTMVLRKAIRDILKVDKPVWNTEMGFSDKGDPLGGTPDEYCDYLLQSYAWGQLAGVERFFHFQLDNSNGLGLYGSVPAKPKPALFTYRDVLVKEFADADFVAQRHGTKGVGFLEGNWPFAEGWRAGHNLFEFKSHDGKRRIWMAFTDTDKPVEITLPATQGKTAVCIDRHNVRTPLLPNNAVYTVALAGATNLGGWPAMKNPKARAMGKPEHLVGGATVVVVEQ